MLWRTDDTAVEMSDVAGGSCDREFSIESDKRTETIAFLLLPGFSLLSLSSFLSPFEKANALLERPRFEWLFASQGGKPVVCSGGFEMPSTLSFAQVTPELARSKKLDMIVLVAGPRVEKQSSQELCSTIRLCRRQRIPVVALGTATWLLAEMGTLQDTRCTIHWEKMAAFAETFNGPKVVDSIYADDGGIWSCAGEIAAFDLAINLIERTLGSQLTAEVCKRSLVDRPRDASSRQSGSALVVFGGANEKLLQAIRLMEQNLQEPLELAGVSQHLDVSRRQLERLFGSYVGTSPHKYYLKLRLDRAKQLIEGTRMPFIDIAMACGFISTSHFAKCFRHQYGRTPTEMRRGRGSGITYSDSNARAL